MREKINHFEDKRSIPRGYVEIIRDKYESSVTSMRTTREETWEFLVTIGLHKRWSYLSPFLFSLIIDELIRKEVPWYMLFADDIVLVDESIDGMNARNLRDRGRLQNPWTPIISSGVRPKLKLTIDPIAYNWVRAQQYGCAPQSNLFKLGWVGCMVLNPFNK